MTYSLDKETPYFLQTLVSLSLNQRLGARWDVVVNASGQELAYRALTVRVVETSTGETIPLSDPPLVRGRSYGVSLGYLRGRGLRFSVDGRQLERQSGKPENDFRAWQVGGTVKYGF